MNWLDELSNQNLEFDHLKNYLCDIYPYTDICKQFFFKNQFGKSEIALF